jgi:dynein heavy chain
LTDAKFITKLDPCIRNGNPVLLENIEETLDPQLEPVLAQEIFKSGGNEMIKLGGEAIAYNKEFKFYMTTKLANPHYLPDICIKVTLINFTVTLEGLEDQLLVEVVKCEQPELEETRNNLIVSLSDFKRQLKNSEDKILKLVAEAGKEILDDDKLLNNLNSSKAISNTVNERMEESERTSYEIARDRENYRGVAIRGSVLYFVVADLANINFMY